MFSANHKISGRQWHRLMMTAMIAPAVVYIPPFLVREGQGVWLLLAGFLCSFLYYHLIWFLRVKMKESLPVFLKEKAGIFFSIFAGALLFLRLASVLIYYLRELCEIIRERLLPETNPVFILAVLLFVGLFFVWQGLEGRGRSAEIVYWIVLVAVVFVLAGGLARLNGENFLSRELSFEKEISGDWWYSLFRFVYLFCPAELLLLSHEKPDRQTATVLVLGFGALLSFVACLGTFGYMGMEQERAPLVALTGFFNLFGSGIFRQDSIFLLFLLISFIFAIGILLAGCVTATEAVFPKDDRKGHRAGLAALVSLVLFGAVLVFTDVRWESGGVYPDLEEKAYLLAMGIDRAEDGYVFTYTFSEKNVKEKVFVCTAQDGKEAEGLFALSSSKQLDFSHVQTIAVGEDCFQSDEAMEVIMEYLDSSRVFSSDTLFVCAQPGAREVLTADGETEAGIQIKQLVTKQNADQESTVGMAANLFRNGMPVQELATVGVLEDGRIEFIPKKP